MLHFSYSGQLKAGDDLVDYGFSDLEVVMNASGLKTLIATSARTGAVVTWSLGDLSSTPQLKSVTIAEIEAVAGASAHILTGPANSIESVAVAGLSSGGLVQIDLSQTGEIQTTSTSDVTEQLGTVGAVLPDGEIILTSRSNRDLSVFEKTSDTWVSTVSHDRGPVPIDKLHVASGSDVVVATSGIAGQLTAYHYTGTALLEGDTLGQQDGTGFMIPTDVTSVSLNGSTFVLAGSAGGQSGALTVLALDQNGAFAQTDHILDTLDTRFGQIQTVDIIPFKDGALVVAGGGDDGLSLLALSNTGQLTHLAAVADSNASGLTNVETLELTLSDDVLHIFVASQADAGISHMIVDLSGMGDILSAQYNSGQTTGTSGDDILYSSAGVDSLTGGDGADHFVMLKDDADADTITDFDVDEDRIDLSNWNFIYDVNALTIRSTVSGGVIEHAGQLIYVHSADNDSLSEGDLRAAIDISVQRIPTLEQFTRMGDNGANTIEGGAAQDTLSGGGGDDSVFGYGGDDLFLAASGSDQIFGGSGTDTIRFDEAFVDVRVTDHNGSSVTLETPNGRDVISDVELFEFSDGTRTLEELRPAPDPNDPVDIVGSNAADTVEGNNGGDQIDGQGGNDTLYGRGGNDTILTGSGNNVAYGGAGNDKLIAGNGTNTLFGGDGDDVFSFSSGRQEIDGGAGDDTVQLDDPFERFVISDIAGSSVTLTDGAFSQTISNVETFVFTDQTLSFTDLFPQSNSDPADNPDPVEEPVPLFLKGDEADNVLTGSDADDELLGYGGRDEISGGLGDDWIEGGNNGDSLYGELGNDVIKGGGGKDLIFGDDGDDRLDGGRKGDSLIGGYGKDIIKGDGGKDRIFGGSGDDILSGGKRGDIVKGEDGNDSLSGDGGKDRLFGGNGDDFMSGGRKGDIIKGEDGHDSLSGDGGKDKIFGGSGNDILSGGIKGDTLNGGPGNDTLSGGTGRDEFVFEQNDGDDVIKDFDPKQDALHLDGSFFSNIASGQAVVGAFAVVENGDAILNFGSAGQITFEGVTDLSELANSIVFL